MPNRTFRSIMLMLLLIVTFTIQGCFCVVDNAYVKADELKYKSLRPYIEHKIREDVTAKKLTKGQAEAKTASLDSWKARIDRAKKALKDGKKNGATK